MKGILTFVFIGFVHICVSQFDDLPKDRNYTFSNDQIEFYFLWDSDVSQSIFWDTIYKKEKCFAFIINNTADSIIIERVGSRADPLYWRRSDNKRIHLPGDTIELETWWSRRHGPFNRAISIRYHSSANLNSQTLYISTKGYFYDQYTVQNIEKLKLNKAEEERQKELANKEARLKVKVDKLRQNNPNNTYRDNGQIRSTRNPNPANNSIPAITHFNTDGGISVEEFNGNGIKKKRYFKTGEINSIEDAQGLKTNYYLNGKVRYTENSNRFSSTVPYQSYYYENGCLKKEVFLNETKIKEYDEDICGKLINHTIINESVKKGKYIDETVYYEKGRIVRRTCQSTNNEARNEAKGDFDGRTLIKGTIWYYSADGTLLFESKFANGKRDDTLSKNESKGCQINLVNAQGKKEGLWIVEKKGEYPITVGYSDVFPNMSKFYYHQYEYQNSDTVAIITSYNNGQLRSYTHTRDKKKRIDAGKNYKELYHQNGFLSSKHYQLKNGYEVKVNYSDSTENRIIGGKKGAWGVLSYKNNRLTEIRSEFKITPAAPALNSQVIYHKSSSGYCIEKGNFKFFKLYNGFIYYYKKSGERIVTEKVVNGVIQGNPEVNFTEPQLKASALLNDLNFNGSIEKKELEHFTHVQLVLSEEELNAFKWSEMDKFSNLKVAYVNSREYRIYAYPNSDSLIAAIKGSKGNAVQYGSKKDYYYTPPLNKVYDFPDVEASYPGGMQSLYKWFNENLVHPKESTGVDYGRVFISFIVLSDGSISSVHVIKGINKVYDREAKRLIRNMPNWIPAEFEGEKVNSRMRLPISFDTL